MRISRFISRKFKIAFLLFMVLAFTVLFSLRVDNRAHQLDRAVTSVFVDRLQPAVMIVQLNENLYVRRMLLNDYLSERKSLTPVYLKEKLREYDATNDRLMRDFELTVLTLNEAAVLAELKEDLATNSRIERMVLRQFDLGGDTAATALYNGTGLAIFRHSLQNLRILAGIQSDIGREIVRGSHRDAAGVTLITYLQIATAIAIGIIIQSLLPSVRFLERNPSKFDLN
jgi:hypothetical protein